MRAVAWIVVVALCVGLTGCSSFGKRRQQGGAPAQPPPVGGARPAGDPLLPPVPTPPPIDRTGGTVPDAPASIGMGGILAGQVVDGYSRRPPPTFIQVVSAQGAQEPKTARIEVAADGGGYFTIQGLQAGQHYQLIARAKDGDRVLAGAVWATPPNPKILIRISEDLATPNTPPVPDWPGSARPAAPANAAPSQPGRERSWGPGASPPRRPAELGPPRPAESAPADAQPTAAVRPEAIAADSRSLARNTSPVADIPSPTKSQPTPLTEPSPTADVPARVPSCALVGTQLHNFALNDLQGRPWEFRRERRGKLVLLDFAGFTWCIHCVQAIPHLNALQKQYGPAGLEVIGVVYEQGSVPEQVRKVEQVARTKHVNYRLLLGGDAQMCPLVTQFGVSGYPTLVLLDETGRIVWRCTGPNGDKMQELEQVIQKRLVGR